MRNALLIIIIGLCGAVCHAGTVARLSFQVQADHPVSIDLPVRYGETIDIEVRVANYGTGMDLSGASVVFHAITNGMPYGSSYQATGHVGSVASVSDCTNGWVWTRLDIDAICPGGQSSMPYVMAITKDGASLMRVFGIMLLSGSRSGLAPQAVPWFDPYGAAAAVSNALATSLSGHVSNTTAHADIRADITTGDLAEACARKTLAMSLSNAVSVAMTNWAGALAVISQAFSNYAASAEQLQAVSNLVAQALASANSAATNSIDFTARSGLVSRATFYDATNIARDVVSRITTTNATVGGFLFYAGGTQLVRFAMDSFTNSPYLETVP